MNPIPLNYPFLSKIFLELIQNQASFKSEAQAAFASIYAEIDSYKTNPNCTCRGKIEAYVDNNRPVCHQFLENYLRNHPDVTLDLSAITGRYQAFPAGGKVFRIKNTPEDFESFHKRVLSERFAYRAVTSVLEGDEVVFYFL